MTYRKYFLPVCAALLAALCAACGGGGGYNDEENGNGPNITFNATRGGTGASFFVGFQTTRQFDAVEFQESDNSAAPVYRVYEICSDGHV